MNSKSLAGHFLVASRHLRDPNFLQSVVLMIHHSDEGAMGVVLNRPADKTIDDVWEMIGNDPCECDDRVFIGGPVPGPLVAVHLLSEFSEEEIMPGLFASSHRDALDLIVRKTDEPFRLYSGHSGWGSGQLESELEVGGWLHTPARIDEVFGNHEAVWKAITQRIGLEIMAPNLKREQLPQDPSLN